MTLIGVVALVGSALAQSRNVRTSQPAMSAPARTPAPTVKATPPPAPRTTTSSPTTSTGKSSTTSAASNSKSSAATKAAAAKAAAKKAADDDDDDDDKPSSTATKSGTTTTAAAAKKSETRKAAVKEEPEPEPEPPQTLVELFNRLGQSKPPPPAPAPRLETGSIKALLSAAPKPAPAWGQTKVTNVKGEPAGKTSPPPAGGSKAAAGGPGNQSGGPVVGGTKGGGGVAPLVVPVSIGKPVGREVLAPNLSQAGVATAVGLGFTVAASSKTAAATDPALVRLVPPDGMSQADAHRALREALPAGEFFRNLIYRPIKVEMGSAENAGSGSALGGKAPSCPENRCYAADLMAWDRSKLASCEAGRKIGVIDTAHDGEHPAFTGITVRQAKISRSTAPITANWHGTGVLAILAGNPTSATPGLIPNAEFILADVFFGDGRGQPISDTASLLQALKLMGEFGVDVVNLSLSGPRDPAIELEIARMSAKGVVFVAAAGNDGPTASPSYPAAYKNVIAVTAVNSDGFGYRHANQGEYIDVAAPGVGIWTAAPGGKQAYVTGTSFATPYVTAVMAVMLGEVKGWAKERILDRLKYQDLGTPGKDPVFGRGFLYAPASCTAPRVATAPTTTPRVVAAPAPPRVVAPAKGPVRTTTVVASEEPRASMMRVNGPEE